MSALPSEPSLRLLVVEDSHAIASQLCRMLAAAFAVPVDVASSLAAARELLDQPGHRYAVAVVDLTLPDAHGGEAVDLVASYGPAIVVLTGSMSEQIYQSIAFRPIADFVLKTTPGAAIAVERAVARLLRNANRHVLVVDDSESFRRYMAAQLSNQRLRVSEAADVDEVQAMLRLHPDIALAVLDYVMPGGDGVTLCGDLRASRPVGSFGIVGVTGSEDPFVAVRFLKAGADDILRKPFLVEEFSSRINACLDHIDTVNQVRDLANRDFLTGLFNRRYLYEAGSGLHANARRDHLTLACAIVDIDFFKKINDTHGHDVGDAAIRAVAGALRESFRASDIVARLGGEEFCILATNPDDSLTLMERLRQRIADLHIPHEQAQLQLTASIGLTRSIAGSLDEMIKTADEALYHAKQSGRNRVVVA